MTKQPVYDKLDESVQQIKRIGDFAEPDQRCNVRQPGKCPSVNDGGQNKNREKPGDQEIGRARVQANDNYGKDTKRDPVTVNDGATREVGDTRNIRECRERIRGVPAVA